MVAALPRKKPIELDDPRYVKALAHPLRVRILAMLGERAASPVQLAQTLDATLGTVAQPSSVGEFLRLIRDTPEGWRLILFGNAAGFVFAVVVLALPVVSFPLLLDRDVGPGVAVRTSLRAVAANPVPMAAWGLTVAALLFLGSLPLFIGLAVAMPVLGHGTWHLYRKVVAH